MTVTRGIMVGLVGTLLLLVVAACQAAVASPAQPDAVSQAETTASTPLAGTVVWGRVPYCNCLATSATANVADALKKAELTVTLKELSPNGGWLYFAVSFEPATATAEQITTAMKAGGAEILDGPP